MKRLCQSMIGDVAAPNLVGEADGVAPEQVGDLRVVLGRRRRLRLRRRRADAHVVHQALDVVAAELYLVALQVLHVRPGAVVRVFRMGLVNYLHGALLFFGEGAAFGLGRVVARAGQPHELALALDRQVRVVPAHERFPKVQAHRASLQGAVEDNRVQR